jgi:AmmeMemoRadiSam system protein A/AmmeMemoRadiSam system protein B
MGYALEKFENWIARGDAMIVFGLISPHPPIIVPEIGGAEIPNVQKTISALENAGKHLQAAAPDKLVIISPHEDHGFDVPLYYLRKYLPENIEIEKILVTEPSYRYYYDFGKTRGEQAASDNSRTAIIASGDLSHVLKQDGPYGYDSAGPKLDEIIVQAVRTRGAETLLHIDPQTLENGAECGLRSVLFLLGACENLDVAPQLMSYEGPFGVGYLVAEMNPASPSDASYITELSRNSIRSYLASGQLMDVPEDAPDFLRNPAAAFVSLHTPDGDLRGCIGTLEPRDDSLAKEVIRNAAAAATQDGRFPPVTEKECGNLAISVDVLGPITPTDDPLSLNPALDGMLIVAKDGRQGVLLPGIPDVTSASQQLAICREKAGIGTNEPINSFTFQTTHYKPSKSHP